MAHEKFLEALKILREAGSIYSAGLTDLENLGPEIFQKEENPVSLTCVYFLQFSPIVSENFFFEFNLWGR